MTRSVSALRQAGSPYAFVIGAALAVPLTPPSLLHRSAHIRGLVRQGVWLHNSEDQHA
jgi:hypothetical protein